MIQICRLHKDAQLPIRGSAYSAGLDLHTIESGAIFPGTRMSFRTGFAMAIPEGYVGLIWPRSKLAVQAGLDTLAGVIDSDYRGEVHILLINTSTEVIDLKAGDRIAQLLIQPVSTVQPVEVSSLVETVRGGAGITDTDLRL